MVRLRSILPRSQVRPECRCDHCYRTLIIFLVVVVGSPSSLDTQAELRITDTGIGIPKEELHNVGKRFHRFTSEGGRSHEGTGIGTASISSSFWVQPLTSSLRSLAQALRWSTSSRAFMADRLPWRARRTRVRFPLLPHYLRLDPCCVAVPLGSSFRVLDPPRPIYIAPVYGVRWPGGARKRAWAVYGSAEEDDVVAQKDMPIGAMLAIPPAQWFHWSMRACMRQWPSSDKSSYRHVWSILVNP